MKKSVAKNRTTEYQEILMDQRMKLNSLEITPNQSKSILWFSFVQNLALLIHMMGFGKLGFFELYFALFSPNIFFVFTEFKKTIIFAIVFNSVMILMPLVFYLRMVVEKKQRKKFNPPRLYDLIVNKAKMFGYFNYILIPLLLLPYCEMNLYLNFCYGSGIEKDPNDDFAFHKVNEAACSDPLITVLRVITLVSLVVMLVHLTLQIKFVFAREPSEANHLVSDSRLADWTNLARKFSLSLFLVPELLHTDIIEFTVICVVILVNIVYVAILLSRFTYYNQTVSRLAVALSITELFFSVYLAVNVILVRVGVLETIDQIYIPLMGIISYICANAIVDKTQRIAMKPLNLTESTSWYLKRLHMMYYYMKAASNGLSLVPRLSQNSIEDSIMSYFRNHFLNCHSPTCICLRIKSREDIHDLTLLKKVDYSEDLNSQDGVITVTAKLFYLKHFCWSRLRELQTLNSESQHLLFTLLKYEVYEMKNFIRASEIIRVLEKKDLSTTQHYELQYLRLVIRQYYDFSFNHRVKEQPFYNLEKFIDIQNSVLEIEDIIYISMRSFYKTLFYLVK